MDDAYPPPGRPRNPSGVGLLSPAEQRMADLWPAQARRTPGPPGPYLRLLTHLAYADADFPVRLDAERDPEYWRLYLACTTVATFRLEQDGADVDIVEFLFGGQQIPPFTIKGTARYLNIKLVAGSTVGLYVRAYACWGLAPEGLI